MFLGFCIVLGRWIGVSGRECVGLGIFWFLWLLGVCIVLWVEGGYLLLEFVGVFCVFMGYLV